MNKRVTFEIRGSETLQQLFLEPWAETVAIDPDETVTVIAKGPSEGELELSIEGEVLTICGWSGSTVHIRRSSQELLPEYELPSP